jgi:hypothetical protein
VCEVKGTIFSDVMIFRCAPAAVAAIGMFRDFPLGSILTSIVLVLLFVGPLFAPVVVREDSVRFWSVCRYVRVPVQNVLFTFARPVRSAGAEVGSSILVVIDGETGKGYRVSSSMASSAESMIEDIICPLVDAADRKTPALLRHARLRSGATTGSLLLGGEVMEGHVFRSCIRRRWFRYRSESCESRVTKIASLEGEHPRVVELALKPYGPVHAGLFF